MNRNDREVFQGRDHSRVNAKVLPARSSLSCHRLGIVIGVQEFPLCDLAVFERYVKITSAKNSLAIYIDVINRFLI